jgi:Fic family protein
MQYAQKRLVELPLCNRLLKEIHIELMRGVRGQEKNPGEFRRSQNWIGPQGGSLKNAVFVTPTKEQMEESMSDLEKYINSEDEIDPLIKIGLVHYQFETIHPFLDGNGRIGRMIITLWLILNNILKNPVLYISYYLKRNRVEYYDRLMEVRNKGHFEQWIRFFLNGIILSAQDAYETIKLMKLLNQENLAKINSLKGRKSTVLSLFNYVERNPIIDIGKTAEALKLQYNTVAKAVDSLVSLGILEQLNTNKRNRRFEYTRYLEILRKDT